MNGSSDPALLRRLLEFELSLERDSSEAVDEFDWGRLVRNRATAAMWSDNFLEIHSPDLEATELAALADELLEPLGIEHRFVRPIDTAHAARLTPGFEALEGWEPWQSRYMVLTREADRERGAAREVERTDVTDVRRAVAEANPDFTKDAVEQRFIRDARLDPIGNARWFAAPADGPPGASCVLYERGGVGQVETVGTLPERRGEGLASAVVMAAIAASRERGDELTFIVADAQDWPWMLYERLGFDRVGDQRAFLRKPGYLRVEGSP
jgi:GNAT superfamily N-acetyltransferase